MPMPWLKLHTEARNNAKLRSLPYDVRWLWFCLLCYASEQEERGTIKATRKIIAIEVSDGDIERLDRGLQELESLGLVTTRDTCDMHLEITFKKFCERQQKYPSDSRDEQRKRKAKSRQHKKLGNVSRMSRVGHESVPSGHDTEEDIDIDKKKPPTPLKGDRDFVLPDWIPRADWDAWIEMRKAIRKTPTIHAMRLAVTELQKLRDSGDDPGAVLRRSILNSWAGVFPLTRVDSFKANAKPAKSDRPQYMPRPEVAQEVTCETN